MMSKKLIEQMVNKFLAWKLPQDFAPDAGISFDKWPTDFDKLGWPTGTNIFTADQARAMIEHMMTVMAPDRFATEEEGEAYFHGYFDGHNEATPKTLADGLVDRRVRQLEIAMNLKTEAQYRQELANAWQLIDAERSATRLMREKLQATNSAAHSLAAQLCAVAEVAEKDGYTLIRRESVMDLVTRWRTQWDAAMKVPNEQN